MLLTTSFIVPALLLAPVTWAFGPIAAFNVAATLGPAITAGCCFLAARTVTRFFSGQVLAGFFFGFSPFVLSNDPFGHLNFTLLFFPSLSFILLYDLCVRRRWSPRSVGVWLAILVIVQFFTGTEVLAISAVAIAVALGIAAMLSPHSAWRDRRMYGTAFLTCVGISTAALAYPLWFLLEGPRRFSGYVWPHPFTIGSSPWALLDPGANVHQPSLALEAAGYAGGVGPNEGLLRWPTLIYFGIALCAFVAVSVVVWCRLKLAWVLLITTVVALSLSFGTQFDNQTFTYGYVWLPWRVFAHLPLIDNVFPNRFSLVVTFGVAMLFTISLDRWRDVAAELLNRVGQNSAGMSSRALKVSGLIIALLGAAVLVPIALAQAVPFVVSGSSDPLWFSKDAPLLPTRSVVLAVPFGGETPMGEQALADLHYDLVNGLTVVPGRNGLSDFVAPSGGAIGVLDHLSTSPWVHPQVPSGTTVLLVRSAIRRWHVDVTVMTRTGRYPPPSALFLSDVYERNPVAIDGVWEWKGPPGRK